MKKTISEIIASKFGNIALILIGSVVLCGIGFAGLMLPNLQLPVKPTPIMYDPTQSEPIEFPDLEIVYARGIETGEHALHFVDMQGENSATITTPLTLGGGVFGPIVTFEDPQCIFTCVEYPGIFSSVRNGQVMQFHEDITSDPLHDPFAYSAIYDSPYAIGIQLERDENDDFVWRLYTFDFDKRSIVEDRIIPSSKTERGDYYLGITAEHENDVVFTRCFEDDRLSELVLWDLRSNAETVLLTSQTCLLNASFSPDGRQIAYFECGRGIMRISLKDQPYTPELLRYYDVYLEPGYQYNRPELSPAPGWSPDQEWLLYHRLLRMSYAQDFFDSKAYGIFLLNLETKEETLVIENGVFPFWRPDVP